MANFKRRKPRRKVRCVICTPHRMGNTKSRYYRTRQEARADADFREQAA